MLRSTTFPWRRPRRELLVLVLVAAAALSPVYDLNAQDNSRLCLSQAITKGHLYNDGCFRLDRARYKGHLYSDKAPGLSLVEIPIAAALGVPPADQLRPNAWRIWVLHLLTSGLLFLACAFAVGRISEGLAPGYGSIALVTFALGTLIGPFAAQNFDQVPAAFLGLVAFLLAWQRRPLAAGLLAGTAVVFEYEAGVILAIVALYVALTTRSPRSLARYLGGVVPGAATLGAYNWLAFGAPWRLSYRYVDNMFRSAQNAGFFGIGLPHRFASHQVFAGDGGLLVVSPVLIAAGIGLVLLSRDYRAEALLCAAVATVFVFLNCGYFLPYGGSPGPRFLIPALPFLALGLGPAFSWRPRLTGALALVSVLAMTVRSLVWEDQAPFRNGIFGELARVPFQLGSSRLIKRLDFSVLDWVLPGRALGAAAVLLLAATAFIVAFRTIPSGLLRKNQPGEKYGPQLTGRWRVLPAVALGLVTVAQASAVSGYPYGQARPDLTLAVQAASTRAFPGQEFDFTIWTSNSSDYQGYGQIMVAVTLPPGMQLLGAPVYERGSGCEGTTTLTCALDTLSPRMSTPLRFAVRISDFGTQTLTASVSAEGVLPGRPVSFSVDSG